MSNKKLDMSEYIKVLENFIENHADEIVQNGASIAEFNKLLKAVKSNESKVARMAIKQYGSIEKYTEAMKKNMNNFSEAMESIMALEYE